MSATLSPHATAQALPYPALAEQIEAVLRDPSVRVPPRLVERLANGASLFVMPLLGWELFYFRGNAWTNPSWTSRMIKLRLIRFASPTPPHA